MIIRKRTTPIKIRKLEAVIPRLPPTYKGRRHLESVLAIRKKGYDGEQKVDRYTSAILKENFTILHNVYLYNKGSSFEIDTLIIGPHSIIIVEIKDYIGTVTFDFILNQFTREYRGQVTGFRNPVIQTTTSTVLFTEWLNNHHHTKDIPIHSLIAIGDPSTIIKVIPENKDITDIVMHGEYIPHQVMKINSKLESASQQAHRKIGALILQECKPFDFDLNAEYGIKPDDLLGGVQCPGCRLLGMNRKHSKWNCFHCGLTSRDAHVKTLNNYFLLFNKTWITNRECRQFLGLESRSVATRLLKAYNLKYQIENKRWVKPE